MYGMGHDSKRYVGVKNDTSSRFTQNLASSLRVRQSREIESVSVLSEKLISSVRHTNAGEGRQRLEVMTH